jgi:hypothetical protein
MLFTDGTILTIQNLREHDNLVLEVASTEAIELSLKIAVAQRDLGYELCSFLTGSGVGMDLSRVVVTDELRDLLAAHTLAAVYRDAYNTHLNDRYLGRWKEFSKASERGLLRLLANGIGMSAVGVPRAQEPTVETSTTGGVSGGSYSVQILWQHLAGNVGEKSNPVLVDFAGGSISVTPVKPPPNVAGWHVFVGLQDAASRQSVSMLAPDETWMQAAALRSDLTGPEVSGPDYYVRNSGQIVRG